MIFVLFTYGGWNEMAYVGAEVKEPRKNILRALLIGTLAVTAIYVLVNLAFVHALGLEGARHATAGRRRARAGDRNVGRPGHQPADLHFRPGGHQRPDFHRVENLLRDGQRASALCLAGPVERPARHARRSLLIQGAITLALVVWFGLTQQRLREHGDLHHARLLVLPDVGGRVGVCAALARAGRRRAALPRAGLSRHADPVLPLVGLHGLFQRGLRLRNRSWEALWSIACLLVGVAMSFYRQR